VVKRKGHGIDSVKQRGRGGENAVWASRSGRPLFPLPGRIGYLDGHHHENGGRKGLGFTPVAKKLSFPGGFSVMVRTYTPGMA